MYLKLQRLVRSIFITILLIWSIETKESNDSDLSECCSLSSESHLFHCLQRASVQRKTSQLPSERIIVATFISSNILSYANHYLFNNLYYLQKYEPAVEFLILSEETGDDYSPTDRRWNKIYSIYHGLDTWAKDFEYIVYLDADILLLPPLNPFKPFNIRTIIQDVHQQSPEALLFMSEDLLDYGNSGSLIVRNHPWNRQFFQRWISQRDSHNTYCDQHVLSKLSLELVQNQTLHHLFLLPFPVINSKFPAIETYNESYENQLLIHFLGEYNEVRIAIGKAASGKVCKVMKELNYKQILINDDGSSTIIEGVSLPRITRKELIQIKNKAIRQMISSRLETFESSFDRNTTNYAFEAFDIIQNFCNFQRSTNKSVTSFSSQQRKTNYPIVKNKESCQDFLLKLSQSLGNSLHYQYINLEKRISSPQISTTAIFQQMQILFQFYNLKASLTAFNMTLQDEKRSELLLREELEMIQDIGLQLIYVTKGFSTYFQKQVEVATTLFILQQRSKLLSEQSNHYKVLYDDSTEQMKTSQRPFLHIIKHEEKLMSDLYSLINLIEGKNKSEVKVIEIPDKERLLQEYIIKYVQSSLRFVNLFYRLQQRQEAQEWCTIALNNIDILISSYHGEERIIVNLRREVYFVCSKVHRFTDTKKAKEYEKRALGLRYHAGDLGHYFPINFHENV